MRLLTRTIKAVSLPPAAALLCLLAAAPPAVAADGRQLYLERCASCHGREGRGDGPDVEPFASQPRDLREGFLDKYPTDELVQRIREGKPLRLALDPTALKKRIDDVDVLTTHLKSLPSTDWDLVREGWLIYADRCQVCHGAYGRAPETLPAGVRRPRDLTAPDFQRSTTGDDLLAAVRHGRVGMPALTPRIAADAGPPLAAFVRLLSPGFELYSHYCARCHGDDGLGAHSPVIGSEVPVKFDRDYFARVDSEDLANGVWHMAAEELPSMPHYRWALSEDEARSIVEYLKQSAGPSGGRGSADDAAGSKP